jgi:hypothetical protein
MSGRVRRRSPRRLLIGGLIWGVIYGTLAYVVQGSAWVAISVGVGTGIVFFGVIPFFVWRLFASEFRL